MPSSLSIWSVTDGIDTATKSVSKKCEEQVSSHSIVATKDVLTFILL